jgi:hypothetical protein
MNYLNAKIQKSEKISIDLVIQKLKTTIDLFNC